MIGNILITVQKLDFSQPVLINGRTQATELSHTYNHHPWEILHFDTFTLNFHGKTACLNLLETYTARLGTGCNAGNRSYTRFLL